MQFDLNSQNEPPQQQPYTVPVPFYHGQMGLGDVIAGITQALGVQPCPPCEARRQALNERVRFGSWRA